MSEEWMRELQSTAAPQQQDVIRWPHNHHHHHKHSISSSFISSMQQHAMQHPARNMPYSGNAHIANMGIEGNNAHAVNAEQQSNHIMSAIFSPSCMTAVTMTGQNNWQPPQEGHYYYMGLQPAAASIYGGMVCNPQQYISCPAMPRTSASEDDNKLGENAEKAPWNECLQTVQYDAQDRRTTTTLYNEHHPNMSMITNAEVEDNGRGRMRVFSEDYTAIQPDYRAGLLRKGIELGPAYTEQVGNSRWHEGRNASSREGLKVQIHPDTDTISNKDPGMVAHARTSSICHSITKRQSQEGNFQSNTRHQLIDVRSAGLEKNRKTQWGTSICMASGGGKDRHSKVKTSKGMRDRRVRLSVSTAAQFYDIQDRLGFEQPSHVFEWLMQKAKHAISELPSAAPHVDHHVQPARDHNISGVGAATGLKDPPTDHH